MRALCKVVVLAVAVTTTAVAQEAGPPARGGQGWSILSGQGVGNSATVLAAEVGFPGLSLTFLRGLSSQVDFGGRLSFNYGFENLVSAIYPGVKGELLARVQLINTGKFALGLKLGAGAFGYFAPASSFAGMTLPIGVHLGIPVGSALMIGVGLDAPLYVVFGSAGGLTVPLLFGAGVEYFLDRRLAATFHARMGPSVNNTGFRYNTRAELAFEALFGIAYQL